MLLKTTSLGFFRGDKGSFPLFQRHTQACMAVPLITDLNVKRALEGLNPHMGAGPDGLFPKARKALSSHPSSVLARMIYLSLKTA